ncbi:ATP-dependent Clp protease ATP-binding subunit [Candidatus Woesebacteria bacterium]|nr:ATP-dependent Clp protease ATP-binding subunit [Candidatus Woesebacteria bacterium]
MKNRVEYTEGEITKNFFSAITNIFLFLPYFFSVAQLAKTLFSPWKNLKTTTKRKGFSFNAWLNDLSFDLISRGMGFAMRSALIVFFFLAQSFYIVLLPFVILIFFASFPIHLLLQNMRKTEAERKAILKQSFVKSHFVDNRNADVVGQWFEYLYQTRFKTTPWWTMKKLLQIPPLARDWTVGYTPTLDDYAVDLTESSFQKRIRGHVIGRDMETEMIERALSQSEEANVIVVGIAGVGKHTILNGLARKMYEGKTNSLLAYKRLMHLNMERMLNEHTDIKKREQFFEEILHEASLSKSVILLIDNFDRYIASGPNRVDLSLPIEKYARTNKIQIIGICTPFEYESHIFANEQIRNLFTKIDVEEISKETAYRIILDIALDYEHRYSVTIPFETLRAVIEKSAYYITTIPFPEKAFQLLDSVCAYTVQTVKKNVVLPEYVDTVLSAKTHTPTTIDGALKEKLLNLETSLQERILGQNDAIVNVSSALRRSFLLRGKRKKPLATFLFLGPTGVGKTETAKAIARVFFGTEKEMMRFDMSLFQTKNDITKLIGSPETLNPGLLTNTIRENPYGVLLLDEIEKAHKDLLNIFLTMLDEGYFTDGYGQKIDCKNLVIIGTSNAGADYIFKNLTASGKSPSTNELINYLVEKGQFSPEFLNRFDGVIAYNPLNEDLALQIARRMVGSLQKNIKDMYEVDVVVSDDALAQIVEQGYNVQYGARNLERVLRQQLEDLVAKKILSEEVKKGGQIVL